jgi:hypothetical protein
MWKLNLGYGSLVVSVSGLIFSHNFSHLLFNFEKVPLILACKLHSSIEMVCEKKFKHCIYDYMNMPSPSQVLKLVLGMKQMIQSSQLNHI